MSDQARAWAAVGRRLGAATGLCTLLPAGFLSVYVLHFHAPLTAVLPHMHLVATLCAALAGMRILFGLMVERLAQAASTILLAGAALAMLAFYGLVCIGLTHWSRVISTEMIGSYAPQSVELLRTLGYPPWLVASAFVALAAIVGLAALAYLQKCDWVAPLGRAVSRPVAAVLGFGLLCIAALSAAELPHRDWAKQSEPLSLSLFPERGETAMQSHAIGAFRLSQLDREEDVVRASYQPTNSARRSNVILIVGDALRSDHLSLLGYSRPTTPGLDALAKNGALRLGTSAVAVCNESSCGLRALASSRYVDRQSTRPITLAEVLRLHGYRAHLLLSGDHTRFYGLRESYGPVDSYFDGTSQQARYVNDDRLLVDRLQTMGRWDGQPVMFQFHLMSSHALGKRSDDTPEFGPGQNYNGFRGLRGSDAEYQQKAVNFYDRGVLQADRVIGEILQVLESGGYLQDALVIITGDHGESLGEHGLYTHAHSVWEPALRVPFVLLSLGQANPGSLEPGVLTSQVDIAPTILRALGMPIPSAWEGLPLQEMRKNRIAYFQQAQYIGLIDARTSGKLYKHWRDAGRGVHFTFDLLTDPAEARDLSVDIPEELRLEWQRLLINRSSAIVVKGEERAKRRDESATNP
jgi:glucan phosphoethanolaminetransferase (alkaline phosphatase superfamily)